MQTTTTKLTKTQQKKARRDAFYKLNVDLGKTVRGMLKQLDNDQMEEILTAYVSVLSAESENDEDTIAVGIDTLRQMSVLAAVTMSRELVQRHK